MERSFRESVDEVKGRAHGRWPGILAAQGVPAEALVNRHGPCPMCGGKDRFLSAVCIKPRSPPIGSTSCRPASRASFY